MSLQYPSLTFVPLDVLTAEEMNQIVANYTSIYDSTIIDITDQITWAETNPLVKQALLVHGKMVVIIYFGANVPHSIGQRIADVPADYRPAKQYWFSANYGVSPGNVTIGTNGQFNCNAVGSQSSDRVSTICIYTI
jgi:hypothetical protein